MDKLFIANVLAIHLNSNNECTGSSEMFAIIFFFFGNMGLNVIARIYWDSVERAYQHGHYRRKR